MKIEIIQSVNELKNEFEIFFNYSLVYRAKLPFVSIFEPLDIDKLQKIYIEDLEKKSVCNSFYPFAENFKEELIPFKYLITKSQKFNRLVFKTNQRDINIYYEERNIWDNRYVIEIGDKSLYVYMVEDGYINHLPVYEGDVQVGEVLKSNVLIKGIDKYCAYLVEGKESYAFALSAFILYLDRFIYSSSYLVEKSYIIEKKFSYEKNNRYYNKDWVKKNFDESFYREVEDDIKSVKEKFRRPLKEQFKSMDKFQKIAIYIGVGLPFMVLAIVGLILLIIS